MPKISDPTLLRELNGGTARGVTVVPLNPYAANDERRKEEDQQLQRNADARAAAAGGRDQQNLDLRIKDAGDTDRQRQFSNTRDLKKDYDSLPAVKAYEAVVPLVMQGLRASDDATGDQTLLYRYAKVMDPGSVVRESEQGAAANGANFWDKAVAGYKKQLGIEGGGALPPVVRERLKRDMLAATQQMGLAYRQIRDRYSRDASDNGIDPKYVIGPDAFDPFLAQYEEYASKPPAAATANSGALQEDGTIERDGGLYDSQGNFLGLSVRVTDDSPQLPPPSGPQGSDQTWDSSYLSQGLSGLNEGIAGTLGLPVDIATAGLNLIPKGVNAIANTNLPEISDPFLGGQWWNRAFNDIGAVRAESSDPSKQFVRRTAQSVGSSLIPAAAVETNGARIAQALLASAGGGAGAATAQQLAPDNPYAELAGELVGTGITGAGILAANQRAAQRGIEASIPTVPQLKEQASRLYDNAELTGATADASQTQALADAVRKTLRDEGQLGPSGRITSADSSTNKALNLIEQYESLPMTPKEMNAVRKVVAEGRSSTDAADQRMAGLLTRQFDDWVKPLAPGFDEARDVASRYLQAETLQDARRVAGTRPSANALRNEYANLERRDIRGYENFSPEVGAAIDDIVYVTPVSRGLDLIGKAAPTGIVSGGLSAGVPYMIGNSIGGPALGATLGGASLTAGAGARALSNANMARRADIAELLARNGGAIEQAQLIDPQTQKVIAAIMAGQSSQYAGN